MIVQLTDKAWAVKAPDGKTHWSKLPSDPKTITGQVTTLDGEPFLNWFGDNGLVYNQQLPAVQWTALGFSDEITEEQIETILPSFFKPIGFEPQGQFSGTTPDILVTSKERLYKRLQSKECTEGRWFIILKQEG